MQPETMLGDEDAIFGKGACYSLPLPPSANRLWRVMNGHPVKTQAYHAFCDEAIAAIHPPPKPFDWFSVSISLPRTRRDPDNSIKPILDALKHACVIRDDRNLVRLFLEVTKPEPAALLVTVLPVAPPPDIQAKEDSARRAIECAEQLLTSYRDRLTPSTLARALMVRAAAVDTLRPETVAAMERLHARIVAL